MKTVHLDMKVIKTKDYMCEKCDKSFTKKADLIRHANAVHLKMKNHKCKKCDKQFAQKSNLNTHMKTCSS